MDVIDHHRMVLEESEQACIRANILNLMPRNLENLYFDIKIIITVSQSAQFTVEQLLNTLVDDDARRWVAYIFGTQEPSRYIHQIETLRLQEPELYFAVTVLWQIMGSWVYGLEAYG